ncbi:collagen alpha-1(I) chain-like [Onychostruthus taczanowskii]|uniref:collagen alpha-1(I) chain-like n=1 Tax=Onychostruthus taczanowskii TaxID=356909 RepID=UPI001B801263|nr:collagen alpha-1(I) chain-like [Onychostruthus taczanowskii]
MRRHRSRDGKVGGGFQHPFCPPFFSSFPFLFLSFAVAGCPPLRRRQRGRSHTSGRRRRRRKKPAPPALSAYLPPSRAAEDGGREGAACLSSPGPTGDAGRDERGRRPSAAVRARWGLPLRLCEGGEGSEEVGSRGGRGGRAATPPRRGSRGKIKKNKTGEKSRSGRPGDSPRNSRAGEGVPGAARRGGPGRDGGSAGAERRLPTAPAWRSGGVCAERAKRGRRAVRGGRIPGKGEERKGNRKIGNSEGTGRLGLGGGGVWAPRFSPRPLSEPLGLCALPSPWLAPSGSASRSLLLPPSLTHKQNGGCCSFALPSPRREAAVAAAAGNEPREHGGRGRHGGRGQPCGRGHGGAGPGGASAHNGTRGAGGVGGAAPPQPPSRDRDYPISARLSPGSSANSTGPAP